MTDPRTVELLATLKRAMVLIQDWVPREKCSKWLREYDAILSRDAAPAPNYVMVPREELQWLADQYDVCSDVPLSRDESSHRLYDISCTAKKYLTAPVAAAPVADRQAEERAVIESGRTHWEGCWRDPKHHACAVAMIERQAEPRVDAPAGTGRHALHADRSQQAV